jgi:hypothetical protein
MQFLKKIFLDSNVFIEKEQFGIFSGGKSAI